MKYYYKLDSENRVIFFSTEPNAVEVSSLSEIDLPEGTGVVIGQHAIVNGSLTFLGPKPSDTQRYEAQARRSRMSDLKHFLASTDYKVTKCFEAFIAEETLPYDFEELKAERQAWRDEINEIESELED